MGENDIVPRKGPKTLDGTNAIFSGAVVVNDLMMMAEEDPLSASQARAYQRQLQFAKTFSLLLSEDGINPKDFDEELEIEYGCKLDDVFKVSTTGVGSIKFVIPSNLAEARAMLQAKYQVILKAPLMARGMLQEDSQRKNSRDEAIIPSQPMPSSILSETLSRSEVSENQKKRSPVVKRTYGRATQNLEAGEDSDSQSAKRPAKSAPAAPVAATKDSIEEPLKISSLSEIESYFYAFMKGNQSYTELKSDYRFECCVCNQVFDQNIKAVLHLHSHLGDSTGFSAVRCIVCYRWFANEPDLEQHMEEHSSDNDTVCRICDCEPFSDVAALASHMQTTHVRREMPYGCRLCGFRSSIYVDVVQHFDNFHAGSSYAQCAFCLQVYQLKPPSSGGPCRTVNFFDHLSRHHGEKESQANCFRCRLTFLGFGDLPKHEKSEHQPGTSMYCAPRFSAATSGVMQTASKPAEPSNAEMDLSRLTINLPATSSTNGPALCRECLQPMAKKGHFGRFTSCSYAPGSCTFASACTLAMANHLQRHRRQQVIRPSAAPPLAKPLYCCCGFSSNMGAAMAAHLLLCPSGSRSCSTVPPVNMASSSASFDEPQDGTSSTSVTDNVSGSQAV